MKSYPATSEIPRLVLAAMRLADELGFEHSCSEETGRLLRVLASSVRSGVVGEIGTGCGVGAAWIVSALAPEVSFVTVELDEARFEASYRVFADYPQVTVLRGDWHQVLDYGPFSLSFLTAATQSRRNPAR